MIHMVDLFAGPGGWDIAARSLGLDPLGIEVDGAACATREAAGLRTWQADVSKLNPREVVASMCGRRGQMAGMCEEAECCGNCDGSKHGVPLDLLVASPPCPTFSTAGKGDGIADLSLVYQLADAIAVDPSIDVHTAMPDELWRDTRSRLVIEPLRWALLLEPRFLAWEQVPPVLPFWEYCAEILRARGWSVAVFKIEAERFGVPQTRERAILMADQEAPVHPPRPTHQRYVKGEPQRHEVTLEGEVLPWVSMAEALGWGMTERPQYTICGGVGTERARGAFKLRNGNQDNATEREAEEPAPTIAFGHNWKPSELAACGCDIGVVDAGGFCACCHAHLNDPDGFYALQGDGTHQFKDCPANRRKWGGDGPQPDECPATTVAGDPRLSSRTHHDEGEQNAHAIRVTLEEAAVLQTFPRDYPFQGSKSQRFLQVGNAVPPLLAYAILSALLKPVFSESLEAAT